MIEETTLSPGAAGHVRGLPAPLVALGIAFLVFGVMGLSGAMATPLVTAVRLIFDLSLSAAIAVQWIALVVSGLCALPLAQVLQRHGAARTTIAGLLLVVLGCIAVPLAIAPLGQGQPRYGMVLGALAIVALGNTALQVAANLLVVELGERAGGAARLTLAQGFNSLGVLVGAHFGASAMLGSGHGGGGAEIGELAQGTAQVYLWCAGITFAVLLLAVIWRKAIATTTIHAPGDATVAPFRSAFRSGWALGGAGAIALYVGAEGAIGSVLIAYLHQDAILGVTLSKAGMLVAYLYWGGALAGRFAGSWLLSTRTAPRYLAGAAILAAIACGIALTGSGLVAGAAALCVGLFNAIMFPVIFTTTVERTAAPLAAVSGLLSTAIIGGALISVAVGWVGDRFGIGNAFAVPLGAYLVIAVFAALAARCPSVAAAAPQESRMTSSVGKRSDLI